MVKDRAIVEVLRLLEAALGGNVFRIQDYWEPDLCAVGICSIRNSDFLVYISTYGKTPGFYFVSLEGPPPHGSDLPYEESGRFETVDFTELVGIVREHLA